MRNYSNPLVFYTSTNSGGKHDATGAFIPEAKTFAKLYSVKSDRIFPVDCTKDNPTRRKYVFDRITPSVDGKLVDCLAFFCHGWQTGIQFGITMTKIQDLVFRMNNTCSKDVTVVLYACLTADNPNDPNDSSENKDPGPGTDGGFADVLRDSLCRSGLVDCRIVAHKTAAHATMNPFALYFDGDGTPTGINEDSYEGGKWFVEPGSVLWKKWIQKLHTGNLRFNFPFMSQEELEATLKGM